MPATQRGELGRVAPPRTISRHTSPAHSLACDSAAGRRMAPPELFGVPVPFNSVRNIRSSFSALYSGSGNRAYRYSTKTGGQDFCSQRFRRGMPGGHLPRDQQGARNGCKSPGVGDLIGVCCVAGCSRRTKASFCGQSLPPVEALEKGLDQDGVSGGVCIGRSARGPFLVDGHKAGLPTLQTTPPDARLVYFSLGRAVLSVRSPALWLGPLTLMVYAVYGCICAGASAHGYEDSGLLRRLLNSADTRRYCVKEVALPLGTDKNRWAAPASRADAASREGRMGRQHDSRALGSAHRQHENAILCSPEEGEKDAGSCPYPFAPSTTRSTVGLSEGAASLLRCLRFSLTSYALGQVLYAITVLGHDKEPERTRTLPDKPPEYPGSAHMEVSHSAGANGPPYGPSPTFSIHTYGRRRHGVRRDVKFQGLSARGARGLGGARSLELERSGCQYKLQGVEGYSNGPHRILGSENHLRRAQRPAAASGQSPGGAHHQFFRLGQPPHDARASQVEIGPGCARTPHPNRMDTLCCQSVCRLPLATLPPRRLTDTAASSAFRAGWNESTSGRVPVSSSWRTPSLPPRAIVQGVGSRLGPTRGPLALPTGRPHRADGPQAASHGSPSPIIDTGLAAAAVARSGQTNIEEGASNSGEPIRALDGASQAEPQVAAITSGSQPRVSTRSNRRMALAAAAAQRPVASRQLSRGSAMSRRLLSEYAWSERTLTSRNSQWQTWLEFCSSDNWAVLPVTEAHFISFVGWIASEREAGRRRISAVSIPQYLSAVRQMQLVLHGTAVPAFPFVWHVLRAYKRWEEQNYPQTAVRCGVPASVMKQIWALGMDTEEISVVRDAAVTLFAFCVNGLRESSVLSLEHRYVVFSDDRITARLSVVKGQSASRVQSVAYDRVGDMASPLDLWWRWKQVRGSHPRFFALPGEARTWTQGTLSSSLRHCLDLLGITDPPHGKFSSHSLRIGSHTEQVLLGFPLEVRLARFGWGPRSQDMATLYFDRTIRTSPASFWIFGPAVPTSAVAASSPL